MSYAWLIVSETGEKIEDVIWNMSCLTVFKFVSLGYAKNTGKVPLSHKQKQIFRKQQAAFKELRNVE